MSHNTPKRKILCMTATRADYPRVRPVLEEIERRSHLELGLVVTGMHLLAEFGNTLQHIEADGFHIIRKLPMYDQDDSPYGMALAAARCMAGMADILNKYQPDICLLTVDRVETLAAAQAAALMNIPIAHIQGGEVTGTIDESIRHAVTKLAHIHFPSNQDAAERIIKMGEDPNSVFAVGCPYVDTINSLPVQSRQELANKYGFNPNRPLVLFTQHPITTEYGLGTDQITKTISALERFPELEIVALYSNVDAGGRELIEIMSRNDRFHIFPNIPHLDFLNLMRVASFMIGNSSAGIREAPSFQLPVINIGTRQAGRHRAANVIDVPHDVEAITKAIAKIVVDDQFVESLRDIKNPYGDGKAAKRIVDVLESMKLAPALIQKKITY